jgi:hypothetical protein
MRLFLIPTLLATIVGCSSVPPEKFRGAPYPPSPVIRSVEWAPANSIIRLGRGSDNWPATWAMDDNLYTAYGDGTGFHPRPKQKLSMGFAKISGFPPDINGLNIYPTNADFLGDGRTGKKASGILAIDRVLFILVRNVDGEGNGCKLGRSLDRARTWQWADWSFDELGYCTFLNFGKAYAQARDEYVYIYSHDSASAYQNADGFILLRVPVDQVFDRKAYETITDFNGERPVWTHNLSQRRHIFRHPGRSRRSSVIYNAPLKRYLWWQQNSATGDTRTAGGFGLYDAPEPWGPWTTLYFTDEWDVGPGETATLPTKWISRDGRSMHLLFSGDDYFSVRSLTVELDETSH